MSRIKKSRKPRFVPTSTPKDDKKKEVVVTDKKPKKKTGKESGNRQKEAFQEKLNSSGNNTPKDPRIGSKKPIDLGIPAKSNQSADKPKTKAAKKSPIAPIREVESIKSPESSMEALEQEIYAIEDDTKLQAILAKQEDDIDLTEAEVDFFNDKMTRHEALRKALGWEDEEEVIQKTPSTIDEEELWDKLDKPDLSSFE
ncbi:Der GTPase-activating protein YihI [Thalassotalea piscium]|uniref:Der GTPase-activating protein YihI n=1 Tax=Thalassotalea piscium TaxID=1230533 RepID=UPI00161FD595|nr:Der GTPase-activating protein YihI [Thalassotalea piscium]